mmetsp:Transcript_1898/g.4294  ORF Transcript_1898/g.4294 Transcript_1898/m.4294 type:complete len:117 (+) Transcript_1898:1985-2335(+)
MDLPIAQLGLTHVFLTASAFGRVVQGDELSMGSCGCYCFCRSQVKRWTGAWLMSAVLDTLRCVGLSLRHQAGSERHVRKLSGVSLRVRTPCGVGLCLGATGAAFAWRSALATQVGQ